MRALASDFRAVACWLGAGVALSALTACGAAGTRGPGSAQMPLLRLQPAALGQELALQQRLTFTRQNGNDQIDALLEVDASQVRLLLHQAGQSALRLLWDGSALTETRADWLPAELSAERVLSDLQLTYWPPASIRASLPPDWTLQTDAAQRALSYRGDLVVSIELLTPQRARLTQHRYGYVLEINSVEVAP